MMDAATGYRLLADGVLLVHWAVVVFVVGGLLLIFVGGALDWRWVRRRGWRTLHLGVIVWVVVQAWLGKICPLTTLEMALRSRAGEATYAGGMVAHCLGELLYIDAPQWMFTVAYSLFGLIVVSSWTWVRPAAVSSKRVSSKHLSSKDLSSKH